MSTPEVRLEPAVHQKIFSAEILSESGIHEVSTQAHPKVIILAGQPGSGKGSLADAAQREFRGDVVTIDPDELRKFHPDTSRFRTEHPYTWSTDTHPDASQLASELREAAVAERKNLIIDTTLGNGDSAVSMIKDLQAKGYDVEVRAMATHRLESELGVDERFSQSLDKHGYARYVPGEVRAHVYGALPSSLDQVGAQTTAPIRIYDREGRELYDSRSDGRSAGQALSEAREGRLTDVRRTHELRDGYREQLAWHRDLPGALPEHPKVAPEAKGPLLEQHARLGVEQGLIQEAPASELAYRAAAAQARGAAFRTLGAVGVAAAAYDTAETINHSAELLHQGNVTGAQSGLLHLGSRTVGMVAGAEALGSLGALAGIESGPGLLVTGAIGGVAGAFGGEKLMDAVDQYRVYHQTDPTGLPWRYDPAHPDQGWVTDLPPLPGATQLPVADTALQNRLDYQASSKLAELRMATPGRLADPYEQPVGSGDPERLQTSAWLRDAQTHTWTRSVITDVVGRVPVYCTETASAVRAGELDQAAKQTVIENRMNSPQGVAAAYLGMYEERGWDRVGKFPESVSANLRKIDRTVMASDGHTYTHDADGQWRTPGMLYGRNAAEGNVRNELDATQRAESGGPSAAVSHGNAKSEHATPQLPARLDDPAHPDHAFFQQTRQHVHALDHSLGRTPDQHSDQIASALTVQARADGLQRIDRIALSEDGHKLWAVQTFPGMGIGLNDLRTKVSTETSNTPMEQSGAQWPQVMQQLQETQQQARVRAQALAQTQQQPVAQGQVMTL